MPYSDERGFVKNVERHLHLLRDGEIDFTDFASATKPDIAKLGAHLMRRWGNPTWFTLDDLMQEMMIGVWHYIHRWDSSRGVSISRYVTWNAMNRAKRALHKARGAMDLAYADTEPSHMEWSIEDCAQGDNFEWQNTQDWVDKYLSEEASAESLLGEFQERTIFLAPFFEACETKKERHAISAIRDAGTIDGAGNLLFDDYDRRLACRVGSERRARNFITTHATRVAARVSQVDLSD